jgi:hypothetical protein
MIGRLRNENRIDNDCCAVQFPIRRREPGLPVDISRIPLKMMQAEIESGAKNPVERI